VVWYIVVDICIAMMRTSDFMSLLNHSLVINSSCKHLMAAASNTMLKILKSLNMSLKALSAAVAATSNPAAIPRLIAAGITPQVEKDDEDLQG